jgi:tetratricopeptide (TPR) repeat protein
VPEPALTDDITAAGLDADVRRDLRGLQRDTADAVARHLVAAGQLVDEDPQLALEHARFARAKASRIAVVREAAGIAAYHAGEWAEALGELRAARRMGGGPGHLAVMADIERALGRPERALELSRGPEVRELDRAESIELAIVAAGARRDLGELDAAVVSLQIPELDPARREPWSARLFYAYADNLLAAGREADALQWFVHAADVDGDGETDAAQRIAELTGEPLPEEEFAFGVEEDAAPAADVDADDTDDADADDADSEVAAEVGDADVSDVDADVAAEAVDGVGSGADADAEGSDADAEAGDVDDTDVNEADEVGSGADSDGSDAGAEAGDVDDADADEAGSGAGAADSGDESTAAAEAGPDVDDDRVGADADSAAPATASTGAVSEVPGAGPAGAGPDVADAASADASGGEGAGVDDVAAEDGPAHPDAREPGTGASG